jgi:hypothetical protein
MKRFFGTPLFANIVALIALGASLFALRESRTVLHYTQRQYAAEKRELSLKLMKSVLQNVELSESENNTLLKEADFKVPTELAILMGEQRKNLESLIADDREYIRWLESEQALSETDPGIWLKDIRKTAELLEKSITLRELFSETRKVLKEKYPENTNKPPESTITPATPIATRPP